MILAKHPTRLRKGELVPNDAPQLRLPHKQRTCA